MGDTKHKVKIAGLGIDAKRDGVVECIIDTGATLTTIPAKVLERVGVQKKGQLTLTLADGRKIKRFYGDAHLIFEDGQEIISCVIFGEEDDPTLIGCVALETGGYTVDPVKGLIRKEYFQQYYLV